MIFHRTVLQWSHNYFLCGNIEYSKMYLFSFWKHNSSLNKTAIIAHYHEVHFLVCKHINVYRISTEYYPLVSKTLMLRQNGCHFANNIFKLIFLYQNFGVLIQISFRYVPRGSINDKPGLAQIMAWCQRGNKPLSKPLWLYLLTHTCVTRPRWVNQTLISIMSHSSSSMSVSLSSDKFNPCRYPCRFNSNFKCIVFKQISDTQAFLSLGKCLWTSLMILQQWFR